MVKYERITLCSSCKTLGARSKTTGAPEQESLHGGIGALTSADCTQAFAAEHRGQRLGWVRVGEDSSPHSSHGDGAPPHACSGVQAPNAEGPTEAPGRPQTVARMSMDPRRKRRTGRGRGAEEERARSERSSTDLIVADSARDWVARSQRGTRKNKSLSQMEPCSARDHTPNENSALGCRPG